MAKRTALTLVVAAMAFVAFPAGGASASHNRARPTGANCVLPPPKPMPPPGDFVPVVDNRYFPLPPGTTLLYRGFEERDRVRDAVTVTHRTRTIVGVRATVVDSSSLNLRVMAEPTLHGNRCGLLLLLCFLLAILVGLTLAWRSRPGRGVSLPSGRTSSARAWPGRRGQCGAH